MLKIKDNTIYLTQGDSFALKFTPKIDIYENDRAVLQISTPITPEGKYDILLEATIPPDLEYNAFVISFFTEDTAEWPIGAYVWTLTVYEECTFDEEGKITYSQGVYTTNMSNGLMYIIGGKKNENME